MSISTISNIILSVLSFALSVISLVFLAITIHQNRKLLENTTCPYINIYFDFSQMGVPICYFVIKNFGASPARFTSLTYGISVKNHPKELCDMPSVFDGLVGNIIAPGQKFFIPFRHWDFSSDIAVFDVTYEKCEPKKIKRSKFWPEEKPSAYTGHFEINVSSYKNFCKPRASSEGRAAEQSLQEIAERLM